MKCKKTKITKMLWLEKIFKNSKFSFDWVLLTVNYLEYRLISKKGEGTFSEVLKA